MTHWKNRIVGHGEEAPDQLLANPYNFRGHPKFQQDAMSDILGQVGLVDEILVNQRTGHVIDGHLRVSLAISHNEPTVPVTYVDLSEDEEKLVLATFDPLAALAFHDAEALENLLHDVHTDSPALQQLLSDVAEVAGIAEAKAFDATKLEGSVSGEVNAAYLLYVTFTDYESMQEGVAALSGGERQMPEVAEHIRMATIDGQAYLELWKERLSGT